MASNLSKSEINKCREYLKKAEPYTLEELAEIGFDGKSDPDRMLATTAKHLLDAYLKDHPKENIDDGN